MYVGCASLLSCSQYIFWSVIFVSLINVQNLTFSYDGNYENIFENVSFGIDTTWKLGFTGRNGRGKTTFFELLMGKYKYGGKISASVDFEYFPFEVKDESEFAIDIIKEKSGIEDYDYWKIEKELSLLDVNEEVLYRQFNTLSGGEKVKILLVSLFLKENAFLLIDEPTNHLDLSARKKVSNYLNSKKGFILVSHDREFLDGCIDHILSINKANIEIQKGNFSSWQENKKRQDNFETSQNEKLKREISTLEKSAKQSAAWSEKLEKTKNGTRNSGLRPDRGYIGHKSAKMMKRSKNAETRKQNAIEEKSNLLKNIENASDLKISFLKHRANKLISFKDVSLFYEEKEVCRNVSFEVNRGDRISLCGKNGCGKSTVLKFINGYKNISFKGNFEKVSGLKISYVSQDTASLSGNLKDFSKSQNIDESLFKTILRKLDFSRNQFEKDIKEFSGGQKKKVLIAKSLCEQAHLYLWDEPLNYINILSRTQIEDLILKYSPTMIFVEHDARFAGNIATKTINVGLQ